MQNATCNYENTTVFTYLAMSSLSSGPKPEYIRIMLCDGSGGRRCKVMPKELYDSQSKKGMHLVNAVMGIAVFEDVLIPGTGVDIVGEILLAVDPKALVRLPWDPATLCGLGDMLTLEDHTPWEFCPRSGLVKCIKSLSKEFRLELDVGFEIEFQLFKQDDTLFDDLLYGSVTALDKAMPVLNDIYHALKDMGIKVTQFHKESAGGQYEFALLYKPVLEMCDKLLLARTAIVAIAMRHQLKASFIPKYSAKGAGNGNHAHISFRETGSPKNVFPDPKEKYGLSNLGQHFMAGVLKHLSVLTNFTAPSPNSFTRLVPGCFSGAFVCWGVDNREAPVRLTSTGDNGSPTNFEFKLMDASANPYVAMAALITAGMDGIRGNLLLPEQVYTDPINLSEEERATRGIVRLPTSTGEAVQLLETGAGDIFREALGPAFVNLLRVIRKREGDVFDKCTLDEQAAKYVFLY